jgi:hypothetical protein
LLSPTLLANMSAIPNIPEQDHHPREKDLDTLLDSAIPSPTNGTFTSSSANTSAGYTLHDTPIENHRPLKVIVVGAGYSGIYHGIRIPERLRNVDLTIYDKNAGVGGTWFENRYPGCACDIPCKYLLHLGPNVAKTEIERKKIKANEKKHSTLLPILLQPKPKLEFNVLSCVRDPSLPRVDR